MQPVSREATTARGGNVMSAAPDTGDRTATMTGIDTQEAATYMEPVPHSVTGSTTSAGMSARKTIAAAMDTRRCRGDGPRRWRGHRKTLSHRVSCAGYVY